MNDFVVTMSNGSTFTVLAESVSEWYGYYASLSNFLQVAVHENLVLRASGEEALLLARQICYAVELTE